MSGKGDDDTGDTLARVMLYLNEDPSLNSCHRWSVGSRRLVLHRFHMNGKRSESEEMRVV